MCDRETCCEELRALMPFRIGRSQMVLVPNRLDDAEPKVLVIIRHDTGTVSNQLTTAEARQLAEYIQIAARQSETLGPTAEQQRPTAIAKTSADGFGGRPSQPTR